MLKSDKSCCSLRLFTHLPFSLLTLQVAALAPSTDLVFGLVSLTFPCLKSGEALIIRLLNPKKTSEQDRVLLPNLRAAVVFRHGFFWLS